MRQDGAWIAAMVVGVSGLLWSPAVFAAEHGGKEHGGAATQEHGGHEHGGHEHGGQAVQAEPSAEQIRQAIRDHIALTEQRSGAFTIEDEATGSTRTLQLVRVHERVGKTGALYYSCTDMRDASTGELLDLDFDVDASGDQLAVVDVRIHKLEGQARYTYDEHDNRIPLTSEGSGSM
jgi:hypothetical protein